VQGMTTVQLPVAFIAEKACEHYKTQSNCVSLLPVIIQIRWL
jgi:hypothetical protein